MFLKDPHAALEYRVDWAAALADGVALASSEWRVEPVEAGGVVVVASAVSGGEAVATLGGGIAGHVYRVGNRAVLSDGTSDERSLVLRVEER